MGRGGFNFPVRASFPSKASATHSLLSPGGEGMTQEEAILSLPVSSEQAESSTVNWLRIHHVKMVPDSLWLKDQLRSACSLVLSHLVLCYDVNLSSCFCSPTFLLHADLLNTQVIIPVFVWVCILQPVCLL